MNKFGGYPVSNRGKTYPLLPPSAIIQEKVIRFLNKLSLLLHKSIHCLIEYTHTRNKNELVERRRRSFTLVRTPTTTSTRIYIHEVNNRTIQLSY